MSAKQFKNFISLNMEYYKHLVALRVNDHDNRKIKNDANVHDYLTHENFSYKFKKYEDAFGDHEKAINKKVAKNSNTMIDCVVSFSYDQFEKLKKDNPNFKDAVMGHLKILALEIQKDFGFEPLEIDFHMDEGKELEDGSIKNNYHAHMRFYNYDHENKCAPLRKFKNNKKPFRKLQDTAGRIFQGLDFQRGISKHITKKEHKKKNDYVRGIMREKENEVISIEDKINNLNYSHKIYEKEFKNLENRRNKKIEDLKDNWLLKDHDNTFKSIVEMVESQKAKKLYGFFQAMEKNPVSKPMYRFGKKLLDKVKPIYNTLHWVFLNSPSSFEIADKKRLEAELEPSYAESKYNAKRLKRLRRISGMKPKLTP